MLQKLPRSKAEQQFQNYLKATQHELTYVEVWRALTYADIECERELTHVRVILDSLGWEGVNNMIGRRAI
jgi:hypothetical protein